eukprot:153164-Rhodomonas_salina.1
MVVVVWSFEYLTVDRIEGAVRLRAVRTGSTRRMCAVRRRELTRAARRTVLQRHPPTDHLQGIHLLPSPTQCFTCSARDENPKRAFPVAWIEGAGADALVDVGWQHNVIALNAKVQTHSAMHEDAAERKKLLDQ